MSNTAKALLILLFIFVLCFIDLCNKRLHKKQLEQIHRDSIELLVVL